MWPVLAEVPAVAAEGVFRTVGVLVGGFVSPPVVVRVLELRLEEGFAGAVVELVPGRFGATDPVLVIVFSFLTPLEAGFVDFDFVDSLSVPVSTPEDTPVLSSPDKTSEGVVSCWGVRVAGAASISDIVAIV